MIYLLINHNRQQGHEVVTRPFKEEFRALPTMTRALEEAVKLGWEDFLKMGVTDKAGVKNQYACGDVDLAILPLEVEP